MSDGERKGKDEVNGWVEKEGEGKVQRERGVFVHTLRNRFSPCLSARHTPSTQPSCHSDYWPHSSVDFCVSSAMSVLTAASNNDAKCISLWSVSSIFINLWFL